MRILVDADACPVVDQIVKAARSRRLPCLLLCDTAHELKREGAQTLTVDQGPDQVDLRLANLAQRGDVVVTQDYGLAAMCLARGAYAIHQDGMRYTTDNIDALLMARHTARKIRSGGGRLRGPSKRTSAQDRAFLEAFEKLLDEVEPATR